MAWSAAITGAIVVGLLIGDATGAAGDALVTGAIVLLVEAQFWALARTFGDRA